MVFEERRISPIFQVPDQLEQIDRLIEPEREEQEGDFIVTIITDEHAKRLYTLSCLVSKENASGSATIDRKSQEWRDHRAEKWTNNFLAMGYDNFFWARLAQIDPNIVQHHMNSLFVCKGWKVCTRSE
jgi:hypothetical protein